MPPIPSNLVQRIHQLIRHCGQQAEQMATQQFEVFEKGPDDYVTTIDAALDQMLSTGFRQFFPADGVITEEDVTSRSVFHEARSRLWCIDPLDGTEDFIQGKRDYAVMVGLLQDYQAIAGWVYAPAHDVLYYGGPDWGVFQVSADASPQLVSSSPPALPATGFCPIVIGNRDQANFGAAIAQLIPDAQFYSLGSFGLKVMEVVLGRAGLYLYCNGRVKLWDTTGPLALATAAGLTCCDLDGQPISFAPSAVDRDTLTHRQPIIVGWAHYIELLRPQLAKAVRGVLKEAS